jgi:hypothetical protein
VAALFDRLAEDGPSSRTAPDNEERDETLMNIKIDLQDNLVSNLSCDREQSSPATRASSSGEVSVCGRTEQLPQPIDVKAELGRCGDSFTLTRAAALPLEEERAAAVPLEEVERPWRPLLQAPYTLSKVASASSQQEVSAGPIGHRSKIATCFGPRSGFNRFLLGPCSGSVRRKTSGSGATTLLSAVPVHVLPEFTETYVFHKFYSYVSFFLVV